MLNDLVGFSSVMIMNEDSFKYDIDKYVQTENKNKLVWGTPWCLRCRKLLHNKETETHKQTIPATIINMNENEKNIQNYKLQK